MSRWHQQGKTPPSPRRTRSGKGREPTPESESDSESPERQRISNTSSYTRKPGNVPKTGYSGASYPANEATFTKSKPPSGGKLYPGLVSFQRAEMEMLHSHQQGKTTTSPKQTRSGKEMEMLHSLQQGKTTTSPRQTRSGKEMEMLHSHQQGKTTTSPKQTRRGKGIEPMPETESDSESDYESPEIDGISKSGRSTKEPFIVPERNNSEGSDSQYKPSGKTRGITIESRRSTPPSQRRHLGQKPGKSFMSSPESYSKSPDSRLGKQSMYPNLKNNVSDDDPDHSPDSPYQQDRKGNMYENQDLKKRHKEPQMPHDSKFQRMPKAGFKSLWGQKQRKLFDVLSNWSYLFISVGFIIVVGVVFLVKLSSSGLEEGDDETQAMSRFDLFLLNIKGLRHHFPSQNDRLWRSVIASSKHVLQQPNSTYPSVILLASQVESPRLSFCIAEKIASNFIKSHGIIPGRVPSTNVEAIKDIEASKQKLKLDKDIQAALDKPSGKAYIIQNLQTLSPQAALLLHGLCDGDNAPYKDVMILMTLELKETTPAKTAHEIENYLTKLWTTSQVEYDKVSAVMSRISNNLVILQQENPATVEKVCPFY